MEEKITTLVAIVGIAVAISKEAREWYKATKKRKTTKPNPQKKDMTFFKRGRITSLPSIIY